MILYAISNKICVKFTAILHVKQGVILRSTLSDSFISVVDSVAVRAKQKQEALLLQRECAMRLLVQILQNIPFENDCNLK